MLSSLYTIVALLAVFALPYAIAIWNLRHTTMLCLSIEPSLPEAVPEYLKEIFNYASSELDSDDFSSGGYYRVEVGYEKDGKKWSNLLQHSSEQTYLWLLTHPLLNSAAPLIVTFTTFFEDETQLTTINSFFFGIYSPDPREIAQWVGAINIKEQWQIHQQKLAELSQTKSPQTLSLESFIEMLLRSENGKRLVETGEVQWVEPGKSYRMTWKTAIRAVYQVARKRKQLPRQKIDSGTINPGSIADSSNPVTPIIELEIEEFYRWQQKQKSGVSQRGKNWLLLGTLALFIASYSSEFSPQSLLIFVAALLLHEGGHVLAMKIFGYRDIAMLFIPFLGALATARKDNASLTEKVWVSLAGPLPGLVLGIGLAIASNISSPASGVAGWMQHSPWVREASWILITLNLFNLLPVYPLDGGQIADLLLFSRNPYFGVAFKVIGVVLLGLLGIINPVMVAFALLIALSIPASFRLAKLSASLRKDLRNLAHDDRNGLLQFLFTQLQEPRYRSLPFVQKYNLVVGLLNTRHEDTAKWKVRVGLIGIYLISLLAGFAGSLYAIVPNWTTWVTIGQGLIKSEPVYGQRAQRDVETATKSLQANPKDVEASLKRSRARLILKDDDGAMADANQVLQTDPENAQAYRLRGSVRQRQGDQTGAAADAKKASELFTRERQKELQQKLNTLNQRLSKNPKDSEAYADRAHVYYSLKRYPEVIADSDRALRLDPKNVPVLLIQGDAYLAINKPSEALKTANLALKLNPRSSDAYELRSRVRQKMGDEPGAIMDGKKAEE